MAKTHRHVFGILWWHRGNPRDMEYRTRRIHNCEHDDCDRIIYAETFYCSGSSADHKRAWLGLLISKG